MQNILVLVGILLVGAVGWYMYQENQRMSLDTAPSGSLQADIQDFIQTQSVLRRVNLETEILSQPTFQNLDTVTGPVPQQGTGRSNPFAL